MRTHEVYLPELLLIGATRGLLGAGLALLVANRISKDQRRIAGTVLVAIGALSTIPLAIRVLGRDRVDRRGQEHDGRTSAAEVMTH